MVELVDEFPYGLPGEPAYGGHEHMECAEPYTNGQHRPQGGLLQGKTLSEGDHESIHGDSETHHYAH